MHFLAGAVQTFNELKFNFGKSKVPKVENAANEMMNSSSTNVGRTSDDDDLYSGYNDFPPALKTDDLELDEGFQTSARLMTSRRPTALPSRSGRTASGSRGLGFPQTLGTAAGFTRLDTARSGLMTRGNGTAAGRLMTAQMTGQSEGNRPMTAVRGAGYTAVSRGQNIFDPLNQGSKSASPAIELKPEDTPEEKIKQLEEKINQLIEDSVVTGFKGDSKKALQFAKDAANKEKQLMKLKEQAGVNEGHDWDITFSVLFNMATQYEACEMYTEALSTYHSISKNKFLVHGAKVKINMGNIYYKQNNPTKAIKMYRMAMDQLASSNRDLRLKLMHNMGLIFLRIGHPSDAVVSFEYIMSEKPSFKSGLHLVVANYMTNDSDKTKKSFQDLLEVQLEYDEDDEKYTTISDDPVSQLLVEVLKNDKLRKLEKERKLYGERCILSAARLIAPIIENTFAEGYHWVTETIRGSKHAQLAHALEISKALVFLKQRELGEAVEILKSFEKKETKVATAAATNLSFMFFLQGELSQAEKYGEIAKNADFYNSSAFVNLGNCMVARGDYDSARQLYLEAVEADSSCVEALYNLGLTSQHLKFYEEALEYFQKVGVLARNHAHVNYQIGRTYELMGANEVALEWYLKALTLVPTDPGILKKLGDMYDLSGDKQQAHQYYFDCYKYDPSDIEVVNWVASYLIDMKLPEKAIGFYERGSILQPNEPRWQMMIGACYRKLGNYTQAIEVYQNVYKKNPENLLALQQLVRISKDMGSKEHSQYAEELAKLEKSIEVRDKESRMGSGSGSLFGSNDRLSTGSSGRPYTSTKGNEQNQEFDNMAEDDGFTPLNTKLINKTNQSKNRLMSSFGQSHDSNDSIETASRMSSGRTTTNVYTNRPKTGRGELDDLFADDIPNLLPY